MHHAIKRSLILPQGAWRSDGADLYGGHFLSLVQQLDIQLLVVTFLVSLMLLVFMCKVVRWNSQDRVTPLLKFSRSSFKRCEVRGGSSFKRCEVRGGSSDGESS
jgi:hypothetical protein